ncbi:hypothetical protein G3I20_34530, partial [Streptomyces sp. SID8111]|uniref:hypothetical protein n=1 Tax=Streptomyces sp. SID8111 TaxID=2706100 RepID=UPI0013BEDB5E
MAEWDGVDPPVARPSAPSGVEVGGVVGVRSPAGGVVPETSVDDGPVGARDTVASGLAPDVRVGVGAAGGGVGLVAG